ncbi:MAG: hypothetical protein OXG78_10485 [Chloroflexi bacterium]|nr:hypothetical protein [Chloroflexota bacterium]
MIAYFLVFLTGLTWLFASLSAPDSARSVPAHPKASVYEIISPVPNQVVTDQVDIIGSVVSIGMRRYFVEYRQAYDEDGEWFPATLPGIHPVINKRLGTFNTTILSDDIYVLRLVVLTGEDTRSTLAFGPIIVNNSPMAEATKAAEAARRAASQATAEYCKTLSDADKPDPAREISVSIDAPLPGQIVSGSVRIIGTVEAAELLNFYFEFGLEADAGSAEWYPATLPRVETVRSGVLGTWTTTTLKDGNYALRLIVRAGDCQPQQLIIGTFEVRNNS